MVHIKKKSKKNTQKSAKIINVSQGIFTNCLAFCNKIKK